MGRLGSLEQVRESERFDDRAEAVRATADWLRSRDADA